MRTIKEWLEELPEPYRTEAIENTDPDDLESESSTMEDAIIWAFDWHKTKQGWRYWNDLHEKIESGKLPTRQENRQVQLIEICQRLRQDTNFDKLGEAGTELEEWLMDYEKK